MFEQVYVKRKENETATGPRAEMSASMVMSPHDSKVTNENKS